MRFPLPRLLLVAILAGAACSRSAGPTSNPEENLKQFELHEIGGLYQLHQLEKNKPPTRLKDLEPFEQGYPHGYQALASGACIAVWGIDVKDPAAAAGRVLAYQKQTPTEGGLALFGDQSIKKLSAAEFK